MLTREHLSAELVELVPSLAKTRPPAKIFDKRTYSPWIEGGLHASLVVEELETLVITGGETDVCVPSAVLGAIDLGYQIILLSDGLCSGGWYTRRIVKITRRQILGSARPTNHR
jgi:nicotinamidase-related amidase